MRDYVKRLLSQYWEVETVSDGLEALEVIAQRPPDLVLSDVMMPRLDGFGLIRELRADSATQNIPVILLSARAGEEARIEGLEAGADDYLTKPFSARELLARVEATLKLAELRKQSETALRESEQKYRSLFESINQGFCLIELLFDANEKPFDYRFVEINEAFEQQSGLVNAVGKTILELVPNLEPQWAEQYGQVAKSGEAIRFEADVASMNRIFDIYAFPSGALGQNLVAVLFADITQRKRREANLAFLAEIQDACARLTTADAMMQTVGAKIGAYLNLSVCAFVDIDEAQDRAIVSYSWHRADAPDVTGMYRISEFLNPAFHVEVRAGKTVVVKDTNTDQRTDAASHAALNLYSFISVPFLRDGQWKFLLNVADSRPRDWRDDDIELFNELANRIFPRLERARAEVALHDREAELREAQRIGNIGSWYWDAKTDITTGSDALLRTYGFDPEHDTMSNVTDQDGWLYPHESWESIHQNVQQALATGVDYELDVQAFRNGTPIWITTRSEVLRDSNGAIVGLRGTVQDITARKQAEAKLLESEERLQVLLAREQAARAAAETANRIKDEFLAVLSHELRTPLNPILGWSKLLRQGKLDAARTKTALDTIDRNAQLQVQLIEDLLDISRILRGKLTLTVAPVDLSMVISAALETVRLAAEAKSLQIQTIISPTIGTVNGDAGRLQQVVWNLLSNAVKFTPEGGRVEVKLEEVGSRGVKEWRSEEVVSPHYPITPSPHHSFAQITITDTGKGINPDFLPYVFEHFRQEDGATTRKFGGLGLGLAIARQIVEMHGGRISVNSPGEGQGAIFTVQLPLAPRSSQLPATELPSVAAVSNLQGVSILVVDDELDSREFVVFVLEQAGALVTSFTSGIEALQAIEHSPPDLIVSDIGMPEMDGYMLLQQIRMMEKTRHIPAIALTAYAGEFDQRQAIAAGFQQHLAKPVDPDAVIKTISTLINSQGTANLGGDKRDD